jgi:hypothetical protein
MLGDLVAERVSVLRGVGFNIIFKETERRKLWKDMSHGMSNASAGRLFRRATMQRSLSGQSGFF